MANQAVTAGTKVQNRTLLALIEHDSEYTRVTTHLSIWAKKSEIFFSTAQAVTSFLQPKLSGRE
jgi:hypothetical protein